MGGVSSIAIETVSEFSTRAPRDPENKSENSESQHGSGARGALLLEGNFAGTRSPRSAWSSCAKRGCNGGKVSLQSHCADAETAICGMPFLSTGKKCAMLDRYPSYSRTKTSSTGRLTELAGKKLVHAASCKSFELGILSTSKLST